MTSVAEFVERQLPERYRALHGRLHNLASPVVFGLSVDGHGAWSLTADAEQLQVRANLSEDRVLTVSLSGPDFEHLVLGQAALFEGGSSLMGSRVLRWDSEMRSLVSAMPGSILVSIRDGSVLRSVLLTPGLRAIDFEHAECTIDCELDDLRAVRAGQQQPMELFIAGKLSIRGDAQLALAFAGLLI